MTNTRIAWQQRKTEGLAGILQQLDGFQLGALALACQAGTEQVPDVVSQAIDQPGDRIFLLGMMRGNENRGLILQMLDTEQNERRTAREEPRS